jgi:hypothetical protein
MWRTEWKTNDTCSLSPTCIAAEAQILHGDCEIETIDGQEYVAS